MPTTHDDEDLLQIDEDAMEEIDIRWQVAMITARIRKFMRKTGRSIDLKPKNGITFDKFNSKSLVGTDNNEDIDWTKEFDAEPVTYAMMALTEVEQDDWSIEFDAEHMHFGQDGLDDFDWSNKADDAPVSLALMATNSELGITIRLQMSLESLEVMLKTHEKNEYAWGDKYEQMEYDLKIRDLKLEEKQKELDQALKERDDFKAVLSRSTVGSYYPMDWIIEDLESKLSLHSSRAYTTRTPYKTTKTRKLFFKSIWVKKGSTVGSQAVLPQTVKKSAMINPKQTWKPKGNYLDSVNRGKSRRRSSWTRLSLTEDALECMTRGQDTLLFKRVQKVVMWLLEMTLKVEESQEKGTIKTSCLDFEKVSYVEELKLIFICFSNLDKKHNVLFTDKECLILSPKFKFVDEDLVILRAPRKNDVYSLDLKNIIPSGGITCLVAKATEDEAVLWHRRLGHLSYTNVLLQKKVSLSSVEQVYMKACMFDDQILSCQSFIMMIKGLLLCGKEKNICAKMDVKSAFLFMANIQEEVYVKQPPGFEVPAHPNRHGFRRGAIDETLFQVTQVYHLHCVKRIFRFNVRRMLVSWEKTVLWQCKKQTIMLSPSTEGEYVAAASCCAQGCCSARDAQGTPTQSAAHSQRTASVQGAASFHGTANSQGTAEIQGTDDFQGTAEPHDAASIPKSPNDYTPTDASQTSGGDEGLLDVYALNRELETQGWQTLSQAKINYVSSRPNSSHLSKVVCSHWSKHHALWVEVSKLKKQKREERSIRKKLIETRCKILRSIEASNVRSETTKELDLETTQSTARQERKRFEELKKTKSKTTLKKPTSLAQERNQMMSFLKGQGYKNLQKLKYPQMKELYDKTLKKSVHDKESLEGISMITELQVIDSPDGEYLIIHRENNHFRAFDTLWEILHVLDRQDLYHLYRVVDDYYEHIPPTGLGLMLLGVHTLEIEDGTMIHMLAERRYPLSRELMIRMLEHGMEVEDESETAITLIHLFILWTTANGQRKWTKPKREMALLGNGSSISIHVAERLTDAEQRRPTIKKLEVKQVEFKLGEDCWEIQVKRSKFCHEKVKVLLNEKVKVLLNEKQSKIEVLPWI
ncbi:ribonuclease H-like domain-containing protein [Tanacetum coccineum]